MPRRRRHSAAGAERGDSDDERAGLTTPSPPIMIDSDHLLVSHVGFLSPVLQSLIGAIFLLGLVHDQRIAATVRPLAIALCAFGLALNIWILHSTVLMVQTSRRLRGRLFGDVSLWAFFVLVLLLFGLMVWALVAVATK